MKSRRFKTTPSFGVYAIVAVGVLAVLLRTARFSHHPGGYAVAIVAWMFGVLIFFVMLRR